MNMPLKFEKGLLFNEAVVEISNKVLHFCQFLFHKTFSHIQNLNIEKCYLFFIDFVGFHQRKI